MKLRFICPNHRAWLKDRPDQAMKLSKEFLEEGKYYHQHGMWEQSIRPLGCAFDAASIFILQNSRLDSDDLQHFATSARFLAFSFLKIQQFDLADQIVVGVQTLVRDIDGRVSDRQQIACMLRKLHLLLAAYPGKPSMVVTAISSHTTYSDSYSLH